MNWNLNDFITPDMLLTFSGMVVVVAALTQALKQYILVDPKWTALGIALVVSMIKQAYLSDFSLMGIATAIANSILIAFMSAGAFENLKSIGGAMKAKESFDVNEQENQRILQLEAELKTMQAELSAAKIALKTNHLLDGRDYE